MFWPLVLPVKVTFWCLAGLVAVVTAFAPKLKWKRGWTFLASAFLAGLAFVPSCTGIMLVIDSQRFGIFEHHAFDDVNDFRVQRYLPPAATDTTVQKYSSGFRARYSISESDLSAYLNDVWTRYGEYSMVNRDESGEAQPIDGKSFTRVFSDLGWPALADSTEHRGPVASNGAGFTIWFSPAEGIAYERAGY